MTDGVVGVDVGGTKIAIGVVTADGHLHYLHTTETLAHEGGEAVMERCLAEIQRAVAATREQVRIRTVGIGTPGQIDYDRGRLLHVTSSLPGWDQVAITDRVQEVLHFPAFIENDANAAALGEARFGAGRGLRHLVCVTLGTGIGGGIISDGRLLRGASGSAAGIGHISVVPDGPPCYCGNRGCVELYSSGTAIRDTARRLAQSEPSSILSTMTIDGAHAVAKAADEGDDLARRILADAGRALGHALVNVVNLVNPEQIVFAGSVAKAGAWLLDPVVAQLSSRPLPAARNVLKVTTSSLDGHAGVYGAAAVALEHLEQDY